MALLVFDKHLLWSYQNADGGTTFYYYSDGLIWLAAAIVLLWVAWFLIRGYRRRRSLRRPRRQSDYSSLKRVVKIKRELSSQYLRPGFSNTIHGVGLGKVAGSNDYCIQVFVSDANQEWRIGAGSTALPNSYRGIPVVMIEMPPAGFLSEAIPSLVDVAHLNDGIREPQEIVVGGISGANAYLTGQSGTIGYFCTRKGRLPRRKEIYLLSNSHVFADLSKTNIDDGDLIMQPSPGEPASNRPIASLVTFTALNFNDQKKPNYIDAAIARLWALHPHKPVIPLIGGVKGYVETTDIVVGETARKFGRTTGYTEGRVFSIYLDIWIHYDRTGQPAFFQDQLLIEPDAAKFTKFVAKGDSGSLLVDGEQHALGLIFGSSEGYGVANPISEVLDRLKIALLV